MAGKTHFTLEWLLKEREYYNAERILDEMMWAADKMEMAEENWARSRAA